MAPVSVHECDCCGAQASGYTKSELHDQGWRFHVFGPAGQRGSFAMCEACEAEFAERRAA